MDEFEKEQMNQMSQMDEGIIMDADTLDKEEEVESPTTEQPEETSEEEKVEEEVEEPEEEPEESPTTEEPEVDELADIKQEMAELKAELARKAEEEAAKTEPPSTEEPIEEVDFFKDLDFDESTTDKESFNKLLNSVLLRGVEIGHKRAKKIDEEITKSIPNLINENLLSVASLEKASERFYDDNKDLVEHANTVSEVYKELAAGRPDVEYLNILNETGTEVRKRLGLKKPVQNDEEPKPPRLPKKKSQHRQSTQPKPKSNSVLDEIDEMDKALGL
jgi:hypothetical protein